MTASDSAFSSVVIIITSFWMTYVSPAGESAARHWSNTYFKGEKSDKYETARVRAKETADSFLDQWYDYTVQRDGKHWERLKRAGTRGKYVAEAPPSTFWIKEGWLLRGKEDGGERKSIMDWNRRNTHSRVPSPKVRKTIILAPQFMSAINPTLLFMGKNKFHDSEFGKTKSKSGIKRGQSRWELIPNLSRKFCAAANSYYLAPHYRSGDVAVWK